MFFDVFLNVLKCFKQNLIAIFIAQHEDYNYQYYYHDSNNQIIFLF